MCYLSAVQEAFPKLPSAMRLLLLAMMHEALATCADSGDAVEMPVRDFLIVTRPFPIQVLFDCEQYEGQQREITEASTMEESEQNNEQNRDGKHLNSSKKSTSIVLQIVWMMECNSC